MNYNKFIEDLDAQVKRFGELVEVFKNSQPTKTCSLEFHSVSEPPPYCVGDKEYTGYLIISEDGYSIADYTWDKYGWNKEFHVNGEAETGVKYWAILPREEDVEIS